MTLVKDYYTIKLHDTDAAGMLFFANQFKIVHDLYEHFLADIGFDFRQRFARRDFFIPIVHAEADFLQRLEVGDTVEIGLSVAKIGKSSFTLHYRLTDLDGTPVGTAATIHVTIDPESGKKIDLPMVLRQKLNEIMDGDG